MYEQIAPVTKRTISRILIILSIILLSLASLFFVIFYNYIVPEFSHKGTARYTQEKCADCRSGEVFYDIVNSHNFEQAGEIVGFVHQYDTFLKSNTYKDIYILDVQCADQFEEYEAYVNSFITYEGQHSIVNLRGGFYLVLVDRPSSSEYIIFAVNDTDRIIRCIYIAGYDSTDPLAIYHIINYDLGCVDWGEGESGRVTEKTLPTEADGSLSY